MMKIEEIQKLLQTIDSLSLVRVEIETDGLRLVTDKSEGVATVHARQASTVADKPQIAEKRGRNGSADCGRNERNGRRIYCFADYWNLLRCSRSRCGQLCQGGRSGEKKNRRFVL